MKKVDKPFQAEENEIKRNLGSLLRSIREANNITNYAMTKEVRLSQSALFKIESGEIFPSPRTLQSLLDVYAVTPNEMEGIIAFVKKMKELRTKRKLTLRNTK